jgi:hypothetical protein
MLGQPAPKSVPPAPSQPPADARVPTTRDDAQPRDTGMPSASVDEHPRDEDPRDEDPVRLPVRGGGFLPKIALAFVAALALIGVAVLAYRAFASGSNLEASVVQSEQGEVLQIGVPGAREGTRVRFHGLERPLEAGRAHFPLRAEDLSIGPNELSVDVLEPGGAVRSESVELELQVRVRADLGPLSGNPPGFEVVIEAPAGSTARLDDEQVELDPSGRGTRRFPIEPARVNAQNVFERSVRYRVEPPEGAVAQGILRTRVPLAALRIDRPGDALVTDAASVEVAGAVARGSTVTVGGRSVEVRADRFVTTYTLPTVGEHVIEVVASAPDKAPRVERLTVRRVADLAAEAARFEVDAGLTYARIEQSPSTYRGRRVAFEGSVFNVDVSEGQSVLQMLVDGCAPGQRCPLWVTYPAATDVARGARVRVLGTLAGEQQYRSQNNETRTDPRVDAVFVLPAAPQARRR